MQDSEPKYIKDARFIDEEVEVQEEWWPRDPYRYGKTNSFRNRLATLSDVNIVSSIRETMQTGDIYRAANETVAFVKDFDGVALYVVADAELLKLDGKYPTDPTYEDYKFKLVTIWPYIYDREQAWTDSKWNGEELDKLQEVVDDNTELI